MDHFSLLKSIIGTATYKLMEPYRLGVYRVIYMGQTVTDEFCIIFYFAFEQKVH